MDNCYAEGGEVEGDNDALMDHVALEMMHAIETKDKQAFIDAFHALVADLLNKMGSEDSEGE
jgi:hypothetical protein